MDPHPPCRSGDAYAFLANHWAGVKKTKTHRHCRSFLSPQGGLDTSNLAGHSITHISEAAIRTVDKSGRTATQMPRRAPGRLTRKSCQGVSAWPEDPYPERRLRQ